MIISNTNTTISPPKDDTNFCRVFELPDSYPKDYCFNGGHAVTMKMVDWFNPWPSQEGSSFKLEEITWGEVRAMLIPFLLAKPYVCPGKQYLVITDFNESFLFKKPSV